MNVVEGYGRSAKTFGVISLNMLKSICGSHSPRFVNSLHRSRLSGPAGTTENPKLHDKSIQTN